MIPFFKAMGGIGIALAAVFAVIYFGAGGLLAPVADMSIQNPSTVVQDTRLIDKQAPYFDLPDFAGDHKKLSDYENQPLVIVFWSVGNPDAADQIKILDDFIAKQTKALVKIVTINTQEERSAAASFMRRGGYSVPVLIDASGSAGEDYRIKNLPTLFFVDSTGVVRSIHAGLMNEKSLAAEIETILR
jgi:peroxiredoxin